MNKSLKIVEARQYNIDNHGFYSEVVNRRRTSDTIAKRYRTKIQTMVTKTLNRKRKIVQQATPSPFKTRGGLRCSRRVNNTCTSSDILQATVTVYKFTPPPLYLEVVLLNRFLCSVVWIISSLFVLFFVSSHCYCIVSLSI